jgi:hypothetical protein
MPHGTICISAQYFCNRKCTWVSDNHYDPNFPPPRPRRPAAGPARRRLEAHGTTQSSLLAPTSPPPLGNPPTACGTEPSTLAPRLAAAASASPTRETADNFCSKRWRTREQTRCARLRSSRVVSMVMVMWQWSSTCSTRIAGCRCSKCCKFEVLLVRGAASAPCGGGHRLARGRRTGGRAQPIGCWFMTALYRKAYGYTVTTCWPPMAATYASLYFEPTFKI